MNICLNTELAVEVNLDETFVESHCYVVPPVLLQLKGCVSGVGAICGSTFGVHNGAGHLNLVGRNLHVTDTYEEMVLDAHNRENLAVIIEGVAVHKALHSEGLKVLHLCKIIPNRPGAVALHICHIVHERCFLNHEIHYAGAFEYGKIFRRYGHGHDILFAVVQLVQTCETDVHRRGRHVAGTDNGLKSLYVAVCGRKEFRLRIVICRPVGFKKVIPPFEFHYDIICFGTGHSHRYALGESLCALIGGNPYLILEAGGVIEQLVFKRAVLVAGGERCRCKSYNADV